MNYTTNKMELTKHSQIISVSVPLKSLTHSALRDVCSSYGLNNISDLHNQRECSLCVEKALDEVRKLKLESELKDEKILKLETELKQKQEEYKNMYEQGINLQNQANHWYKQSIEKIEELELKLKQ